MPHSKTRGGRKARSSRPAPPLAVSPAALRLAVPALVVLFSAFAWSQQIVYEDAFFYFRVVDVFLHSGVLAYNPAERYETNTDFLWTFLLMPGIAAGVSHILWMQIAGVAVYASALLAVFVLVKRMFSNGEAGLLALVLLGGHFSFAHFAATGFAPVLQGLAAVCSFLALFEFGKSPNLRSGAALGFALLFLALCRLDSAVMGVPLVLCALFFAWQNGGRALPAIVVAMGIPSVLFGGVLLWKWSYYGDIFPATYYVKGGEDLAGEDLSGTLSERGAAYVAAYWRRYFLWLLAGIAAFGYWRTRKNRSDAVARIRAALLWTMAAACILWYGYMLRTGGGLYEFRLLMPQAPLLAVLAAAGIWNLARNWRWATAAAAVAFSFLHWQTLSGNLIGEGHGGLVLPLSGMSTRIVSDGGIRGELDRDALEDGIKNWVMTADAFSDLFEPLGKYPPEVRVAYYAGGLFGHYAPLLVTEMRGWADSRIGKAAPEDLIFFGGHRVLIGHHVLASPQLLARLGVNLVIGSRPLPNVDFSRPLSQVNIPPAMQWAMAISLDFNIRPNAKFPPDTQLFAMPMQNGQFLPIVYFNRNETIDRILDERGIERVDVFQ